MHYFYDPFIIKTAKNHTLPEEESKHIVKVLRMVEGDELFVQDGVGNIHRTRISKANPKKCNVEIIETHSEIVPDYKIHVALAPTKQMERIEWFVEKATEIGITEISLIHCKNTERITVKKDRIEKKAIAAMKQSQRTFLPVINDMVSFSEFVKFNPNGLIAHCYNDEKNLLTEVFSATNCPILIGPEGDFTKEEVDFALQYGYKTITLGKNRLRTETAALFACMQAKLKIDQND